MGDAVFQYVAVGNSPPVGTFTAADAGQSTVMDDIAAAGDVDSTILLNRPFVIEQVSETIEVGQSFVFMQFKNSPLVERVLFPLSLDRLAFVQEVLSQWAAIPIALGKPVQPETTWSDKQFQAASQSDRDAMNEIDAAPDVQTRTLLRVPLVQYIRSPTIRVTEVVMFINFPNTTESFRVYVSSTLDFIQFVQHFVIPLATARSIGVNV